jgi:hypothetical protein
LRKYLIYLKFIKVWFIIVITYLFNLYSSFFIVWKFSIYGKNQESGIP